MEVILYSAPSPQTVAVVEEVITTKMGLMVDREAAVGLAVLPAQA